MTIKTDLHRHLRAIRAAVRGKPVRPGAEDRRTGRRPRVAMLPDVAAERLALADLLDSLDEGAWDVGSLCPDWTVRDVVAHLTFSTRQPLAGTMLRTARARGDIMRVFGDMARERACAFTPAELVAQLRATADADRRFAPSGRLDPLTDVLVHAQDIARPLGRVHPMPPRRVVPALGHVTASPFYGAPQRFAGVRLVATDADWTSGSGTREVRGPAGELLLLATGRAAGLAGVTGAGVDDAASRMWEAG